MGRKEARVLSNENITFVNETCLPEFVDWLNRYKVEWTIALAGLFFLEYFQEFEGCIELPTNYNKCEDIASFSESLSDRKNSCVRPNKPKFDKFSFGDCRNLQQQTISIVRICQVLINYHCQN